MFCSNCGKELAAESKFCNVCGARTATEHDASAQKTKNFTDEEIRAELKRYKQLNKGICLECGYQGLVGVSDERVIPRWKRTIAVIIMLLAFTFVAVMFNKLIFWLIAVPIAIVAWIAIDRHYRICPNCGSKLK